MSEEEIPSGAGSTNAVPERGSRAVVQAADATEAAPALERFFRGRGHGDDSEDLVQDLFVLLLSKGAAFSRRGPGPFRSLLFAIAYRLGANAGRRRRRTAWREAPPPDALVAPTLDPEARALLAERARRAATALDALPEGTRRALLLVADEGLSTTETAELLGVTEEAVRARLCRGRRRLAEILGDDR